jgi:DNA-binding response OmpR family regulator
MGKVPYYSPATGPDQAEPPSPEKGATQIKERASVVLVGSTEEDSNFFQSSLDPHGYRTLVTDYAGAYETVCREYPDVIVLDLDSKEAGWADLVKKLQSSLSTVTIPVLLLKTGTEWSTEVEGLREGAAGVLPRPLNPAQVVARLDEALKVMV